MRWVWRGVLPFVLLVGTIAAPASATGNGNRPAVFEVGASVRDITPNPTVAPPDGNVWLGGFGFGRADRLSTGVNMPISARAMVISNGTDTVAFAINETQGMFASYTSGPYGLDDMRAEINAQTGIPMDHIVLGSDHTHRGPDTTGVWGGVPDSYLKYIKDQMVGAVVDAYRSREAATITVGSVDAPAIWGCCTLDAPEEDVTDSVINILQARSTASPKHVIATFVEAPYHSTDYGSDPTIDPDWPGHLAAKLEATYGGAGIGWEGDIGRQYAAFGGDDTTNAIFAAAQSALQAGHKLRDATVDGRVTFFTEPVTNPVYMYFLSAANSAAPATCAPPPLFGVSLCTPIGRTTTPPYGGVAFIGSEATVLRVGDVLFAGGPGEAYPNIQKALVENVTASQHFFLGLAQDQLGYLIAPVSSWAAVVPQGGDNGLFNASPTIGDHVACTQLAGARAVGFQVTAETPECAALTSTDGVQSSP